MTPQVSDAVLDACLAQDPASRVSASLSFAYGFGAVRVFTCLLLM